MEYTTEEIAQAARIMSAVSNRKSRKGIGGRPRLDEVCTCYVGEGKLEPHTKYCKIYKNQKRREYWQLYKK